MQTRGSINNRGRAKQLRDFSGLRFGNITPTDIDGLIEYQNKAYIIFELKLIGATVPPGQRLALERLTDDLEKAGKQTLCIIASHNIDNYNKDIDAANTSVTEYRLKGEWTQVGPEEELTTRNIIEKFLSRVHPPPTDFSQIKIVDYMRGVSDAS